VEEMTGEMGLRFFLCCSNVDINVRVLGVAKAEFILVEKEENIPLEGGGTSFSPQLLSDNKSASIDSSFLIPSTSSTFKKVTAHQYKSTSLPNDIHEFDFHFLGLIGFVDPIRPEVPDAVVACHNAGIKFFFWYI
jgi:hypothetical protein